MQRVVIRGRGASGKSTLARRLGAITKLPVIELDKLFWQPGLLPTPRESWSAVREAACRRSTMDHGWRLGSVRRSAGSASQGGYGHSLGLLARPLRLARNHALS